METWIIISLYVLQTLVGAVLWRRFDGHGIEVKEASTALWISVFIVPNILGLIALLYTGIYVICLKLCTLVDFLAGKTNKKQ